MIDRMPPPLQSLTQKLVQSGEFPGPKKAIESDMAQDALIQYEDNLERARLQDNTDIDSNPALGILETKDMIMEYHRDSTASGITEYYTASKGGPMKISTYSRSTERGLDIVLGVTDNAGKAVFKQGAIHLDRVQPGNSFLAGDLEEVPTT